MATATIPLKGSASMESKKVSISSKRQITIPQKFFTLLGFNTEAECIMRGNELVLRPVKENTSGEFAEQILADLIRQGYSGEELLEKFKQTQRKIRPAVEAMLAEADRVAETPPLLHHPNIPKPLPLLHPQSLTITNPHQLPQHHPQTSPPHPTHTPSTIPSHI